ncbi:MAG: molybdopterin-dependent oxidoreductase [Gammaproteobacteria bacterium]|nr:molybdopterin-dependent oxidoreductase [Gammaproteobacteria bacterium]MCW8959307.1 molybdopterin-dependent oxidoreductase [Gammaproteobacteria bacterium]MCW8972679.1 molybdopterin-dependent oxidoreductase [Gammaproteobacteria bacterium]MCW8992356.1 molybdopterin-dependent oxidoreductase [Gammaproteobacteria bacterium]
MKEVKTTCPYCGVGCGVIASTAPDGTVTIKGDPDHPANFGRLCSKGAALGETLDMEGRLLHPIVDGQVSDWDTALDSVASRFRALIAEHGPDAVAFYVSGQLLTEDYYVANKLMKGFIGSANIDTNSRLCMSSAVAAYKRAFGSDSVPCSYADLERAKLIVITGSNTAWCHPVVYQRIVQAKKRYPDIRIVVIDPRRTATCEIADLHLPLKPGSDAFLFNGMLHYLDQQQEHNTLYTARFTEGADAALAAARDSSPTIRSVAELCALDGALLEQFFDLFARTERVVTLFSQGINQSSSGTDKGNAIINCHLLTGRIGRPGMGPFSITGQPNAMGGREVGGLANQLAAHMELEDPGHRALVQSFWQSPAIADKPGLKAVDLFRAVEEGKVKAVWIMATNPVVSMPDADRVKAALEKCELVVVSDNMAHTDTVDLAHIKLPALGWGEKEGTVTNSERCISRQRAFLAAPGSARADWWILSEVAKRMGFAEQFAYALPAEIFSEHARLTACHNDGTRDLDIGGLGGLSAEQYDVLAPRQWPVTDKQPEGSVRLFSDGRFFTPNGKARFIAVAPQPPAHEPDEQLPLCLNTGRVRDHWHTMTRSGKSPRLATHTREPYAELHPQDAARHGIEDNALVKVEGKQGSITVRAHLSERQQPGSLFVPIHWNAQFASAARVDALISAVTDPVSGQPESKHAPARIVPCQPAWFGFLLSRRRLTPNEASYWSCSRGDGLWRYQLAGDQVPADWAQSARAVLCSPEQDVGWIEYFDPATQQYRAARIVNGSLESCLHIGPDRHLPAHDWIEPLFAQPALGGNERIALLAGKPLRQQQDAGPSVCACFGVGSETIRQTIREKRITSIEQITKELKAGGNCGSCLPELKALLHEALHNSAERTKTTTDHSALHVTQGQ